MIQGPRTSTSPTASPSLGSSAPPSPDHPALHGAEQPALAVPVGPLLFLARAEWRVRHAGQRRCLGHAPGLEQPHAELLLEILTIDRVRYRGAARDGTRRSEDMSPPFDRL